MNATELVLGVSRRGRLSQIFSRSVGTATANGSGPIDVHLVTHEEVKRGRGRPLPSSALSRARRATGFGDRRGARSDRC